LQIGFSLKTFDLFSLNVCLLCMKTYLWRKPAFVGFFCFGFSLLQAQTPCANGQAGAYPCHQIDLLGHLSPEALGAVPQDGVYLNDIWGWTDPEDGTEYALVGMANGTAFVNISDPANPWLVGVLPEPETSAAGSVRLSNQDKSAHLEGKSVWRDLKVYQDHVFIVSDYNGEHGMQVFDLRQLRTAENAPVEFRETAHYAGISRAHNLVINEESGFAFIVGASGAAVCGEGGLHMVDIRNPAAPVYAGCFDADGYTHDAQCVI
jgi:choice-of-anchor B domain-containing protein